MKPHLLLDWMWSVNIRGPRALWTFASSPVPPEIRGDVQRWVEQRPTPGLCLYGKAGVGKTGLMIAAMRHYLLYHQKADFNHAQKRYRWALVGLGVHKQNRRPKNIAVVWFDQWRTLAHELHKARQAQDEDAITAEGLLDALRAAELLAIDDLDTGAPSDWKEETVLLLIDQIEMGQRMMVTMNHAPSRSVERLGQRIADRLSDGLLWTTIEVPGVSKRSNR